MRTVSICEGFEDDPMYRCMSFFEGGRTLQGQAAHDGFLPYTTLLWRESDSCQARYEFFEDLTRLGMHGNRRPSAHFSSRPRKRELVVVATGKSVSLSGLAKP